MCRGSFFCVLFLFGFVDFRVVFCGGNGGGFGVVLKRDVIMIFYI